MGRVYNTWRKYCVKFRRYSVFNNLMHINKLKIIKSAIFDINIIADFRVFTFFINLKRSVETFKFKV